MKVQNSRVPTIQEITVKPRHIKVLEELNSLVPSDKLHGSLFRDSQPSDMFVLHKSLLLHILKEIIELSQIYFEYMSMESRTYCKSLHCPLVVVEGDKIKFWPNFLKKVIDNHRE